MKFIDPMNYTQGWVPKIPKCRDFFRVVFRYLAIAVLSFFRLLDSGKTTHREVVVPGQKPPVHVRGGQVTDWEASQVLAALAVSESSAALR